ncbi:MAG: cytochrome c biogenesis protein ResB, partial [Flavobacteriaceae bacterium]
MKQNPFGLLSSNRLMGILFLLFPAAMAMGTFIETWYSTDTAKIWIYDALWFEALMGLLLLNFLGNIFKYRLLRKEKWAILLLHLSFILILFGAFITRYVGYEGVMPIREGETTASFLSEKTYLTVWIDGDIDGVPQRKKLQDDLLLSEHTDNGFRWDNDFNGQDFSIAYVDYTEEVAEGLVLDPDGDRYLTIVEAGDGTRHEHYLKEGEVANIHNILFTLNNPISGAINIRSEAGLHYMTSPFAGDFMRMADQFQGSLTADTEQELQLRSLYRLPSFQFVIPDPPLRSRIDLIPNEGGGQETGQDALELNIQTAGVTEEITLLGGKGNSFDPKKIRLGGLDFYLQYGSLPLELPFSIRLNDFIAEKYPGTENSYSSFKSKITVEDSPSFDYEIFMNHVLDHRGYRFFQASFSPDEKGTVLSVNHDFWGTWITYVGYILLYLSMMGIFFIGDTRFKQLSKRLIKMSAKKI